MSVWLFCSFVSLCWYFATWQIYELVGGRPGRLVGWLVGWFVVELVGFLRLGVQLIGFSMRVGGAVGDVLACHYYN